MRRRLPLLAVVAVLAFAGCTGKPENSPYIRNKFAEFDDTKKNAERMNQELAAISGDLKVISDQITELRALAPDSTGTSEVIQRLNNLEKRIADMDGKSAPVLQTKNAPAPAGGSTNPDSATVSVVAGAADVPTVVTDLAAPAGVDTVAPPPAASTEVAKATETKKVEPKKVESKKVETKKGGEAMKPGAKKTDTKVVQTKGSAGKYYTVQAGDTVQSIAKAHGVSVDVLLKENRIPAGARVPKGQRLYIPGAK